MTKVYVIKKLFITDMMPELEVETFKTSKARDKAWQRLVHDHNNMIQDAYEVDLNDSSYEEKFYYEWDDNSLVFYDKIEPTCHYDFFEKDEEVVYE